jgi:hypothetical protein
MSGIREQRKKIQKSVLYWVVHFPADKALPELLKLKQTVDSQIVLLQATILPLTLEIDANRTITSAVNQDSIAESQASIAIIDAEVA